MCKYHRIRTERLQAIGKTTVEGHSECALKRRSEQKMVEVYEALFSLGLEGTFVGYGCPVAPQRNWHACPYYEPA